MTDFETVRVAVWTAINRACHQCRGTGSVRVKHGMIYCTDSAEEIDLAYQVEACPTCAAERTAAAAALARIEQETVELQEFKTLSETGAARMGKALSDSIDSEDVEWPKLNRGRGLLIDKSIAGTISDSEMTLLAALNGYTDARLEMIKARAAVLSLERRD